MSSLLVLVDPLVLKGFTAGRAPLLVLYAVLSIASSLLVLVVLNRPLMLLLGQAQSIRAERISRSLTSGPVEFVVNGRVLSAPWVVDRGVVKGSDYTGEPFRKTMINQPPQAGRKKKGQKFLDNAHLSVSRSLY